MKKILNIFLTLMLAFNFAACSDDDYNEINNSGEVKILSFAAGNSKLSTLNEEKGIIELVFPTGTDLTTITPVYTLSEGARILSPSNAAGPIDLSKTVTYTIVSGNLYHDYKVTASHANGKILTYSIGKYKGVIDENSKNITVRMPLETDVTALNPIFTINEGAKLMSPTATILDFTNPVTYIIEYLDETFAYTVTVELGSIMPVAFLGAANTAAEMTNMDDKAAYDWMASTFPQYKYISFADIKNGTADLTQYGVLWFHYDPDQFDIPVIASDATVVEALKNFSNQGGGLLLTAAGVRLGTNLDIARDGRMWNNDWGWGNSASELGEDWGVRFTGNEDHPIFKGLRMEAGEDSRFYLLGRGVKVKGHNAIWSFDSWTGYNFDVSKWESDNGSKQLASFYWDEAMNQRSIITEYERSGAKGATITIAVESYDWYHEDGSPANSYRDNLETLTYNILNYLSNSN